MKADCIKWKEVRRLCRLTDLLQKSTRRLAFLQYQNLPKDSVQPKDVNRDENLQTKSGINGIELPD